jgi:hypothetical protein
MSNLLKNIIRFALFILLQVFVLDKIPPLNRFVIPTCISLILWLPFKISRGGLHADGFYIWTCAGFFYESTWPPLSLHADRLCATFYHFAADAQEAYEISYAEPSSPVWD